MEEDRLVSYFIFGFSIFVCCAAISSCRKSGFNVILIVQNYGKSIHEIVREEWENGKRRKFKRAYIHNIHTEKKKKIRNEIRRGKKTHTADYILLDGREFRIFNASFNHCVLCSYLFFVGILISEH